MLLLVLVLCMLQMLPAGLQVQCCCQRWRLLQVQHLRRLLHACADCWHSLLIQAMRW
jgi:hypothetical protein